MASANLLQDIEPAAPLLDFEHEFKGFGIHPSKCRVRIFTDVPACSAGQERFVVILSDIGEGTSVTNAADQIATAVLAKLPAVDRPMAKLYDDVDAELAQQLATVRGGFVMFLEHYARTSARPFPESFSRISFTSFDQCGPYYATNRHGYSLSGASFRHIERSEVERLIGGRLE